MENIKIKSELEHWLVNYITSSIHGMHAEDSEEFNKWAKSFREEEASFVVRAEFFNDWGYDKRDEVTQEEAKEYAHALILRILDSWHL